MITDFPTGKYNIIYADPPWPVKFGTCKPNLGPHGLRWRPPLAYQTLSIDEIKRLPIEKISDIDCHLYLWVVNKYIEESYSIVRGWGFKPIVLLTWAKNPMGLGLGGAFVQTTEHILFCRRGNLKSKRRINTTWFNCKRQKTHSVKPEFFRDLIIEVSGDLPRIELFARQSAPGWDCWGNEIPNILTQQETTNAKNSLIQ